MLLRIFEEATKKINCWLGTKYLPPLLFDSNNFCFSDQGVDLANWIRFKQYSLYKWSRCPEGNPPIEIAALSSLSALIKSIEQLINDFPKKISVSVYFDEQETYLEHQQVIINDWIKNPPEGWVFNVAHRRYLDYVRKTSTNEIIDESNDFRIIDLDLPLVSSLPESSRIREEFYRKIVQYEVRGLDFDDNKIDTKTFSPDTLLPSGKLKNSESLRKDNYANEAWKRLTARSSKLRKLDLQYALETGESLKDDRLWVLWPILIARGKHEKINELKIKDYFHNHLNGAILQIYFESKGRAPMEYYSGFSAFCSIVLSNVREFILILQRAIEYEYQNDPKKELVDILKNGISTTNQYKAVMDRSKYFNNIVAISAAERGHDIERALLNWSNFFSAFQRLPTLPYNEPNHIICSDSIDESSPAWKTIDAGEKHGAFIITLSSKQRENTKENQKDIRIHPLLTAKYFLSYTKRNTPPLKFKQIETITTSTDIDKIKKMPPAMFKKEKTQIQGELF